MGPRGWRMTGRALVLIIMVSISGAIWKRTTSRWKKRVKKWRRILAPETPWWATRWEGGLRFMLCSVGRAISVRPSSFPLIRASLRGVKSVLLPMRDGPGSRNPTGLCFSKSGILNPSWRGSLLNGAIVLNWRLELLRSARVSVSGPSALKTTCARAFRKSLVPFAGSWVNTI